MPYNPTERPREPTPRRERWTTVALIAGMAALAVGSLVVMLWPR